MKRRTNHGGEASDGRADAEALGVRALSFIAGDPVLLPRFLALSGIEAADIRRAATEPGFLAGVLRFLTHHEPSLQAFCDAADISPATVMAALRALPGGDDTYMAST